MPRLFALLMMLAIVVTTSHDADGHKDAEVDLMKEIAKALNVSATFIDQLIEADPELD